MAQRPNRARILLRQALSLLTALMLLLGCDGLEEESEPPTAPPSTSAASAPTPIAVQKQSAGSDPKWTVMLYLDADDEVLEEDIFTDLNEVEKVGSSGQVQIVAQIDRYEGGFDGDGDWSTARRFYVTRDDDMEAIGSQELADLGEINMADGATLVDFVTWAMESYPAEHYALILSDHGSGWPGGWSDGDSGGAGQHEIALAESFGDMIYLMELEDALGQIQAQTGLERFDVIGLDACLMAQLEVMSALQPYARYAVLSEAVEPALGYAYAAFLQGLVDQPEMAAGDLAQSIVQSYIDQDSQIVDERLRARYVERNYDTSDELSAEEVAEQEGREITLAAVDLSQISAVTGALDALVRTLPAVDRKVVARTRTYAEAFENIFEDTSPRAKPYIDLGNWARVLQQEAEDEQVSAAAEALLEAIGRAVVAERHGDGRRGATGISLYFPNARLAGAPDAGLESYTSVARTFAGACLWDDYLAYTYGGKPLPEAAAEAEEAEAPSPAEEEGIAIAPLELSAETTSTDEPVTLSTRIEGDRIAYIYLYVGYYDEESGDILTADMDFIDAEETRRVEGVIYPDWGDGGTLDLEVEWQPTLFALRDGEEFYPALFSPLEYGAGLEDTTYVLEGLYTFARSGERRYALLYFSGEGKLRQIVAYQNEEPAGPLSELRRRKGDRFTILEQWIPGSQSTEGGVEFVAKEGQTITFGGKNPVWEEAPAPAGSYVLGIMVEDLDGNVYDAYASLTVE